MATSNATLMAPRLPSSVFRQEKHGHQYGGNWSQVAPGKLLVRGRSASAMPSQRGDTARAERLKELNKLSEDVAKTAVSTGPRGAIRVAQCIEAVVTVRGECLFQLLTNLGAVTSRSEGPGLASSLPGPAELRRLFEKLGATYIKLGQFIASAPTLFPPAYVKEFQSCLDMTPPVPRYNCTQCLVWELVGM